MKAITNIRSWVVKEVPKVEMVRESRLRKEAMSWVGRVGDLRDKSKSLKKRLFSGILKND